jgi:hypothetical protein
MSYCYQPIVRRCRSAQALWLAAALGAAGVVGQALATTSLSLDPRRTYLRTNNDASLPAVPLSLAARGIVPGDRIELARQGDFDNGPGGDTFTTLTAVFSASDVLLPSDQLHRVPDALDAGVDLVSAPTHFGGLPTDIPEDFVISSSAYPSGTVCVIVPTGATHLFFSAPDSLFFDNSDPDGDWGVAITLLNQCAADLDSDGSVAAPDLAVLLGAWGASDTIGAPGDLDCDADVDASDLALLLGAWGPCPG